MTDTIPTIKRLSGIPFLAGAFLHTEKENAMSHATTRRAIMAGTASLPALAAPAAAFTAGPVFAAIEQFRAAWQAHEASCADEPAYGHPDKPAWEKRQGQACEAELDALRAMLQTRPTSKAGAVAMLKTLDQYSV
jgi:hypothetical protein